MCVWRERGYTRREEGVCVCGERVVHTWGEEGVCVEGGGWRGVCVEGGECVCVCGRLCGGRKVQGYSSCTVS